jgi:hypothetical protein
LETGSAKKWPLRCPDCGDLVLLELPVSREADHTGTTVCLRGHAFIYQDKDGSVRVVGGRHVRGRHKPSGFAGGNF